MKKRPGCRRAGAKGIPALRVSAALVAGVLLHAGGAALQAGELHPVLPREAQGEIPFVVDATLFLDAQGRSEIYFVLAVPQREVQCVPLSEGAGSCMQLELLLTDLGPQGQALLERSQSLEVPCAEEDTAGPGGGEPAWRDCLVYLRAPWGRSTPAFSLRLEDRNAVRAGLLYKLKDEKRRGEVSAVSPVADVRDGVGLSGCLFLWDFLPNGYESRSGFWIASGEEARAGLTPHPGRFFGSRNAVLRFYLEAYGLDGDSLEVTTGITRAGVAEPLFRDVGRVKLPAAWSSLARELDVRSLPAGSYLLTVEVARRGSEEPVYRAAAGFQMLWRPESWMRLEREWLEEASLILDESQLETFRSLLPGEREVMEEGFWAAVDGAHGQVAGPTRLLFRERLAHADKRFGGRVRGSQTDRGRVYVRFGEPDEVQKELLPKERDRIAAFLHRELDEAERSDAGSPLPMRAQDTSAYEVWTYVSWGQPLFPAAGNPARGRPLEFVFVDKLGTGEYRLIYTNLHGDL